MTTISSTDARQNFAGFLDRGSREIIVVKRQQREIGAFIPMADLEKLRELKNRELNKAAKALAKEANQKGLTEKKLRALLAEVNPS